MAEPVSIHIVSDTMCPWCYVGKRRLEKALASLPEIAVSVHWRPYLLDGTIPADGMDRQTYLQRKFGAQGAADVYSRIRAAGEEEGIHFAFEKILRSPNTVNSHRLLHWAEEAGVQDAVAERLFQLYFIEGGDIGSSEILATAAEDSGMDRNAVYNRLQTDDDRSSILRQIAEANDIGIDGVPCFIFNGGTYLPGAQPAPILALAVQNASAAG